MNLKHPEHLTRTDRLNFIIERMRTQKDITPLALAEELNISPRTIYRDIRTLQDGEALKKRYSRREGRYIFEAELTLPPLRLTASEAVALLKAAHNPALSPENFHARDLESGLTKLCEALAPENRSDAVPPEEKETSSMLPSFSIEVIRQPLIEKIRRAIQSNHKLCLYYWPAPGDGERDIMVSPYDIRAMQEHWYLLGKPQDSHNLRLFKLSCIRAVDILPDRFRFPRRFSADALFARAWETLGNHDEERMVQIRIAPALAVTLPSFWANQFCSMEFQEDGSLHCEMVVHNAREIAWWILSYGDQIELMGPPEMRAQLGAIIRAMAAIYADPPLEKKHK